MGEHLKDFRPGPLRLGNLLVDPPLILAPMAGITDEAYRCLMAEHGAGLVTTEMVSVEGLRRNQPSTWRLCAQARPLSVPLAVQLFGRDPAAMAEAAKLVESEGASLIDINAGCPVKKVVRQGAGASLLRDPDRLAFMVEEVRKSVGVPVTVKIRLGWDGRSVNVVETAQRLSSAGADAITIHGRTAAQHYEGKADWEWIRRARAAVDIPVIGNGDVTSPSLARSMLLETGCDAVMIGRASLGNPWMFSVIASQWGRPPAWSASPGWADFYETVCGHLEASSLTTVSRTGTLRKLLNWYSRGCPEASRLRSGLSALDRPESLLHAFHVWVQELMEKGIPFLPMKVPEAET